MSVEFKIFKKDTAIWERIQQKKHRDFAMILSLYPFLRPCILEVAFEIRTGGSQFLKKSLRYSDPSKKLAMARKPLRVILEPSKKGMSTYFAY